MSTTIDNRVVEMEFDNKHFEKNVATSLDTLDKLKKSLDLTGAAKGLEEVNTAADKCDMSVLSKAADTVKLKFSALQVMAVTALANITNSAVNAGKRIVSALTIDPIKSGFQEYETQINAVQTILANTESKGKTLDDVNGALDELNKYADKTIYNFTEMTRNIGTFTAAGVDLDTSVAAIKGIANLAAVSGSTSQQASTAMYQLSQALASGTVKLMDWNSVVNAGMGGQVFQDALKETARVHGIAIDDLIKQEGSFRETLQHGWLSADILTETLSKFTGDLTEDQLKAMGYTEEQIKSIVKMGQTANDAATKVKTFTQLFDTLKEAAQSGWTQTWEILVGDFDEAKELFTSVSDTIGEMIGKSAEARNDWLENWKVLGGRKALIDGIKNAFEGIISIITPIKEAFKEIFPSMTAEKLTELTEGFRDLMAHLKLNDKTSDNLKRTFKGLFAVLDIVKRAVLAVIKAGASLFGIVGEVGGGILSVTARFGDWLVEIRDFIKETEIFDKGLQGVVTLIKGLYKALKSLVTWIGNNFIFPAMEAFHSLLELIHERFAGIGEAAYEMKSKVSDAFSGITSNPFIKMLESLWKGIKTIGSALAKAFGSIASGLTEKIGNGDFNGLLDFINGIITGGIGIGIIKFLDSLSKPLESLSEIGEGFSGIIGEVGDTLGAFQAKLKADALVKIATAIAILAASILVISLIDSDKLNNALSAIAMLFTELMISMSIFARVAGRFTGVTKACAAMISMSIAVLILAAALRTVANLEFEEVATGLLGIAGMVVLLVAAVKVLGSGERSAIKGATQMVLFAAAIKILASALNDIAYMRWEDLAKGLLGIGILIAELSLFVLSTNFSGKMFSTCAGIVLLASAIKILASACFDFSLMSWEEIGKGLAAVGALLIEIALFTKLTGNANKVVSTGIAMIAIAAAMKIFASAAKDMARLTWEEIAKGLVAMAGALTAVTIALKLMPTNMVSMGVGVIAVATALLIISAALEKMSGMSWESIAKSLITLSGAMVILALGLKAMTGTVTGSAAMVVATIALGMLAPVLAFLGAMSWGAIAKGLITIAGAFTIIGVAGLLLKPITPAILGLAGAMLLIGVGVLAAGIGLTALAAGLSALSIGFTALIGSLGVVVTGIVGIVSAVVVGVIKGIAEGIVAICSVITEGAPAIGQAVSAVILAVCGVIGDCAPVIADTLLRVIASILRSLVEYTPSIIDALAQFIIGVIDGLARNIPEIVKAIMRFIGAIFDGIFDAIKEVDTESLYKMVVAVGILVGAMAPLNAVMPLLPGAMKGVLGIGIIIAELALVLAAVGAFAQIPGLSWLINEGGNLLESIGLAIGKFIGGLAGGIMSGMTGQFPEIGSDLSQFMTNLKPFLDGARSIDESTLQGVKSIVDIIMSLTAASIIEGLTSWFTGGSSLIKFGEEIAQFGPCLKRYADSVSGIDPAAVKASASAAKALAEMADTVPNEGGIVSWFAGDNSIAKFGPQLVTLGEGLKGFADATSGINPESMIGAANAAKALAEMADTVPNEGGMVTWFAGDNSIAKFGDELAALGKGLKAFFESTVGINPTSLTATATAAKSLADMTEHIPNEGGMASWFAGDRSVSKFANDLVSLGKGLKGFSDETTGVNPDTMTASAAAAKSLAEMTNAIPNEGGMLSWFIGENSVSKFAGDLVKLGEGIKGFSDKTTGVNPDAVTAAANAAKSLAEMSNVIPNSGGMVTWFTGDNSVAKFGSELVSLGEGLKGFSDATAGVNPETMTAAANAGKALAEMSNTIPNSGGIAAWFGGEKSVSKFAGDLVNLGKGLKQFSDETKGVQPETITAASNSAKALGEMASVVPDDTSKIVSFGKNLISLGSSLSAYYEKVSGVSSDSISGAKSAVDAVKDLGNSLDAGSMKDAAAAIKEMVSALQQLTKVNSGTVSEFKNALSALGKTSVDALVSEFEGMDDDMKKAGTNAINAFIEGANGRLPNAKKAFKTLASACASAISDKSSAFETAGKNVVSGFAAGIGSNMFQAVAKARAMAIAALEAAKDALGINSPSKEFYEAGGYSGLGFVNGLVEYGDKSYTAGQTMANSAKAGLRDALSRIRDIVNGDMDMQPTIRPVLDLSDVKTGAGAISSILGSETIEAKANVSAISSMMNRRNQNGNEDVVSAIDKLRGEIGNLEHATYNINGVSYEEGSDVADALKTIIRAATMERRS